MWYLEELIRRNSEEGVGQKLGRFNGDPVMLRHRRQYASDRVKQCIGASPSLMADRDNQDHLAEE